MAASNYFLVILFVLASFFSVSTADVCTTGRNGWLDYDYTYCSYGCCGNYPNEYCCSYTVGLIVGICFSVVAFICIIIAVVCCCVRRRHQPGTIVSTYGQSPMVVCSTNQSAQYPAPYAPPAYPQPVMAGQAIPPPHPPAYSPPQEGFGYTNFGYKPQPTNGQFASNANA